MPASVYETRLVSPGSFKGISTILLTTGGLLLCLTSMLISDYKRAAFPVAIGLSFLLAAFCLRFNYQDFAADKANGQYRYFNHFLGLRLGSWQELPPVTGVVMKYFSAYNKPLTPSRTSWGVWEPDGPQEEFVVLLSTEAVNHQGLIVTRFSYRQKEQAAQLTSALAKYFDVSSHFYDSH